MMELLNFDAVSKDGGWTISSFHEPSQFRTAHAHTDPIVLYNCCYDGITTAGRPSWAMASLTRKVLLEFQGQKFESDDTEVRRILQAHGQEGDAVAAVIDPSLGGVLCDFNLYLTRPATGQAHKGQFIADILKLYLLQTETAEVHYQVFLFYDGVTAGNHPSSIRYTVSLRGPSTLKTETAFHKMLSILKNTSSVRAQVAAQAGAIVELPERYIVQEGPTQLLLQGFRRCLSGDFRIGFSLCLDALVQFVSHVEKVLIRVNKEYVRPLLKYMSHVKLVIEGIQGTGFARDPTVARSLTEMTNALGRFHHVPHQITTFASFLGSVGLILGGIRSFIDGNMRAGLTLCLDGGKRLALQIAQQWGSSEFVQFVKGLISMAGSG